VGQQVVRERLVMLAELSRKSPRLVNLARFIDQPLLEVVGNRLRLGAAAGVDKVSTVWYRENLDLNIHMLIKEVKNKSYQPSPTRRVSILKDDKSERHLGLPTTRDKHLQGAVLALLEAIYEPHFYDHSYGFRPNRSAKDALLVLLGWLASHDGAWVLEVDLSKFFDTIDHVLLLEVLSEKIGDHAVLDLIEAWLKAGVMDKGVLKPTMTGTPQGGVVSPIAANVFLDKALDQWWIKSYLPALTGEGFLVRYADDFIIAFTDEDECRQAALDVTARLKQFKLSVNMEKTKTSDLRLPCATAPDTQENTEVNFLGFNVYWKPCPDTGRKLAARTSDKSIKRFKERITSWLLEKGGDLLPDELTAGIDAKLKGHANYFDVEGNEDRITLVEKMAHALYEFQIHPDTSFPVPAPDSAALLDLPPYEDRESECQPGLQN
jgi:group II intron reverse transcriptase/maturase